jgi:hypothetical protein
MPKPRRVIVLEGFDDLSVDPETGKSQSELACARSVKRATLAGIPWISDQDLDVFSISEPLSVWVAKLGTYLVVQNQFYPTSFLTAQLDVCYNQQDDPGKPNRPGLDLILHHWEQAKTDSQQPTYWTRLRDIDDKSNVVWIACPSKAENNSPYAFPTVFYFTLQFAAKPPLSPTSPSCETVRVRVHITTYHTEDSRVQSFHVFPPLDNLKSE